MKVFAKFFLALVMFGFGMAVDLPLNTISLANTPSIQKLAWTRQMYPVMPSPRYWTSLAYNPSSQEALLFGGADQTFTNDLWAFDGLTWRELPPFGGLRPAGRADASLAYDQANKNLVLFGGIQGYEFLGSTWIYQPATWSQHFTLSAPSPRAGASLAYDPIRQETILFGGYYFIGLDLQPLNDTWAWNGTDWRQLFPVNTPPARAHAGLVFDPASQALLLYGGNSVASAYSDTWIWDGSNWQELHPLHNPGGRYDFGLVFDETLQQIILFGGQTVGNLASNETWTWDGRDWNRLPTAANPPAEFAPWSHLVYLPKLKGTAAVGMYSPKDCIGEICASANEMQVWTLAERLVNFLPILNR